MSVLLARKVRISSNCSLVTTALFQEQVMTRNPFMANKAAVGSALS